ncbi:hypothetical protein DSCW_46150 [Desulfosarcina widdelii]|uniref:DUF4124 domain-containing protein n=1 Tax=Desulfosarcina widdelii TaxID=947919 RepID=A0A5K7Z818_9BACT|nr:DUF4124 domain-containing protein [Desulfosarcina widdelii]BBO77198.1 hypothetical protein DSCW_46150 [Desulfosarcina widdelii]
MRWISLIALTACLLLVSNTVPAGTIYTWTDADGVKHYSNEQPPEGIDKVQTIEEVQYDQAGADQKRQEYDRMVEEASEEADRHFDQQAQKKARQEEERQQQQQEEKDRRIAEQRDRLEKEIEAVRNRALGPNFTQGMKDNLIRQLQEKIDQLK